MTFPEFFKKNGAWWFSIDGLLGSKKDSPLGCQVQVKKACKFLKSQLNGSIKYMTLFLGGRVSDEKIKFLEFSKNSQDIYGTIHKK